MVRERSRVRLVAHPGFVCLGGAGGPELAQFQLWGRCRSRPAFWQPRYYDRYIRNSDEFLEKLRYIHRNPVKRGLCASPEQWPWSSFRHYWNGADLGVEIESEWTVRARQVRME